MTTEFIELNQLDRKALEEAVAGIDDSRWAVAELAADWKERGIRGWAEIISQHPKVRRKTRTVYEWAQTAIYRNSLDVRPDLPFTFYIRCLRFLDILPVETIVEMMQEFEAEAGADVDTFSAQLAELAGKTPHVAHNSGENEWYTPPAYIEAARCVMGGIDLDPASSEVANRIVNATKFYTVDDDGLQHGWSGRVWMNPPYAAELIGKFSERLAASVEEGTVTEAVVLVNNATETHWFERLVDVASAVVFTHGRVKFLDPQGNPGAPLQGQAVVYAGPSPEKFLSEFAGFGWGAQLCK